MALDCNLINVGKKKKEIEKEGNGKEQRGKENLS